MMADFNSISVSCFSLLNLAEFLKNKFKGTLKNCLKSKQDILVGDSMLNNELWLTVCKGTVDRSNYDFGKLSLKEKKAVCMWHSPYFWPVVHFTFQEEKGYNT